MVIKTSRFGLVELKIDDVITFPEGLLGFKDLREFVLLDDPHDDIFAWLQSCELPTVAFPVLEPEIFGHKYSVALNRNDLEGLKLATTESAFFFNIITIPDDPTQMTANIKAPIIINQTAKIARQCVLQDNHLAIKEPIFTKLQSRVVQFPQSTIKSQGRQLDIAVKISDKGSVDQEM
ncbi:MAG: flagellar assembly protein FliW [Bdellovibrionales bacterium RIFCSPHIGHO2_01_FULL_40_29]|nr:MAG: flagellar assembly protein FliW [Bdellovibrionales bacterium RIFCSPHIGHO2_01_FULL_40_29]OFZ34107.1 MAG: flagellar assembly protein FliW [Bdellovibrionales bacterium RIFCSPHIGHO2_02_FULL_40_15]